MLKMKDKISKEYLKKMVEYMVLSDRKYNVRLDVYVTEEYDKDYENVIGYKLCYIQNELGLEIIGPAQCLVPFFLLDNIDGEKQRIKENLVNQGLPCTDKDVDDIWIDEFNEKVQYQIQRIKKLFEQKR